MSMSRNEKTAAIRKQLKAMGYNARQVSVRGSRCTYSSSIDVTIKDASVPLPAVKAVVDQYTAVRRCEVSGDILGGGNTYTSVDYAHDIVTAKAEQIEPQLSDEPGRDVVVEGVRVTRDNDPNRPYDTSYTLAAEHADLNDCERWYDKQSAARGVAIALFSRGYEHCGQWVSLDK